MARVGEHAAQRRGLSVGRISRARGRSSALGRRGGHRPGAGAQIGLSASPPAMAGPASTNASASMPAAAAASATPPPIEWPTTTSGRPGCRRRTARAAAPPRRRPARRCRASAALGVAAEAALVGRIDGDAAAGPVAGGPPKVRSPASPKPCSARMTARAGPCSARRAHSRRRERGAAGRAPRRRGGRPPVSGAGGNPAARQSRASRTKIAAADADGDG